MMLIEARVAPSSIHGLGLFTVRKVSAGTPVWKYQPGFDQNFSPDQFSALPPTAQLHISHYAFVMPANGHRILSGDHACFMNHAFSPNTGASTETSDPVITVALRDLAAGEEITCDYFAFDAEATFKLGHSGLNL